MHNLCEITVLSKHLPCDNDTHNMLFPISHLRLEREIILKQNLSVFKTTFADKLLLKYLQNSFFQVNGPFVAERSHGTKLPN